MKKIIAMLLIAVSLFALSGCSEKLAEWKLDSFLDNGVAIAVPAEETKNGEWYCTADLDTNTVLTVNLIYPAEYGELAGLECTANGKKIKCEVSSAEQNDGNLLFYKLPAEISSLGYDGRIVITQKFEKKTVKIAFKPSMVAEAF